MSINKAAKLQRGEGESAAKRHDKTKTYNIIGWSYFPVWQIPQLSQLLREHNREISEGTDRIISEWRSYLGEKLLFFF